MMMMMRDLQGKKSVVEKEVCSLHTEQLSDRRGYQSTKHCCGKLFIFRARMRMNPEFRYQLPYSFDLMRGKQHAVTPWISSCNDIERRLIICT